MKVVVNLNCSVDARQKLHLARAAIAAMNHKRNILLRLEFRRYFEVKALVAVNA